MARKDEEKFDFLDGVMAAVIFFTMLIISLFVVGMIVWWLFSLIF